SPSAGHTSATRSASISRVDQPARSRNPAKSLTVTRTGRTLRRDREQRRPVVVAVVVGDALRFGGREREFRELTLPASRQHDEAAAQRVDPPAVDLLRGHPRTDEEDRAV